MTTSRERFHVLVASDGSAPARAAVRAATVFPWPRGARASGVVAWDAVAHVGTPASVRTGIRAAIDRMAAETEGALRERWPDARCAVVDGPPDVGILGEARRVRARAIVTGSTGRGGLGRLLVGSVTRALARRATVPLLVVKGRPLSFTRLVVGFDGSRNARRAIDLVARLAPPRGGRVTVVRAVVPEPAPRRVHLPPAARRIAQESAAALAAEARRRARAETETAARLLARAGWKVGIDVRVGGALDTVLAAARDAHLIVVGARGATGLRGLLLGSVATGALDRARVSVLVVR